MANKKRLPRPGPAALRRVVAGGTSAREISRRLDVSHQTVCLWLGGETTPRLNAALAMRDTYGIPVEAWR